MLHSDNYDKISLEVYKEIYLEAKTKHEEVLSQSEIITGRGIKILVFILGLAVWAATALKDNIADAVPYIVVYVIFLGICIWNAMRLLFPKQSSFRGTDPETIYKEQDDLMNPKFNSEKVFYFQQINRYQTKISLIRQKNKDRIPIFKLALILSFVLLLATISLYMANL